MPARLASQSTASARSRPVTAMTRSMASPRWSPGPAAPAFVTASVAEHRHRGAVVVVVRHRAVPLAARPHPARGWVSSSSSATGRCGRARRRSASGCRSVCSPSWTIAWSVSNRVRSFPARIVCTTRASRADLPDRTARHELAEPAPFAFGEVEHLGCAPRSARVVGAAALGSGCPTAARRRSSPPRCRRRSAPSGPTGGGRPGPSRRRAPATA